MTIRDTQIQEEERRLKIGWAWIILFGVFYVTLHNLIGAVVSVAVYFILRNVVLKDKLEIVWQRSLLAGVFGFIAGLVVALLMR